MKHLILIAIVFVMGCECYEPECQPVVCECAPVEDNQIKWIMRMGVITDQTGTEGEISYFWKKELYAKSNYIDIKSLAVDLDTSKFVTGYTEESSLYGTGDQLWSIDSKSVVSPQKGNVILVFDEIVDGSKLSFDLAVGYNGYDLVSESCEPIVNDDVSAIVMDDKFPTINHILGWVNISKEF